MMGYVDIVDLVTIGSLHFEVRGTRGMKCLECKWNDELAPQSGKCCGECGLCPLCEMSTRYTISQVTKGGNG